MIFLTARLTVLHMPFFISCFEMLGSVSDSGKVANLIATALWF